MYVYFSKLVHCVVYIFCSFSNFSLIFKFLRYHWFFSVLPCHSISFCFICYGGILISLCMYLVNGKFCYCIVLLFISNSFFPSLKLILFASNITLPVFCCFCFAWRIFSQIFTSNHSMLCFRCVLYNKQLGFFSPF